MRDPRPGVLRGGGGSLGSADRQVYAIVRHELTFDAHQIGMVCIYSSLKWTVSSVPKHPVANLVSLGQSLPINGWKSFVLGTAGTAQIKLFRVDPNGLAQEVHPDWSESLVMLDGEIELELNSTAYTVRAGEQIHIPAGQGHAIRPGGHGVFILVDPAPLETELQIIS